MDWWLIAHTPAGPHVWQLGDPDDDLVMRAKVTIGFPPGDDWHHEIHRWNCMLTQGEPHPTLMKRATLHTAAELMALPAGPLATFRQACADAVRIAQTKAAREAIAVLAPADRDTLLAELRGANPINRT